MQSNYDRVINVPIQDDDIVKTVTCLPRTSLNDGYITVNLKRMKSLKKIENQQDLNPNQLMEALEYLRLHHPDYHDVLPNEVIDMFMDVESEGENGSSHNQNDDLGK